MTQKHHATEPNFEPRVRLRAAFFSKKKRGDQLVATRVLLLQQLCYQHHFFGECEFLHSHVTSDGVDEMCFDSQG